MKIQGVARAMFVWAAVSALGLNAGPSAAQDRMYEGIRGKRAGLECRANARPVLGPVQSVWFETFREVVRPSGTPSSVRQPRRVKGLEKRGWYQSQIEAILDENDQRVFDEFTVMRMMEKNVPLSYVRDCLGIKDEGGNSLRGYQMYRYFRLGVSPKEIGRFTDTKKPNAVVIFPYEDVNQRTGIEGAFDTEGAVALFQYIRRRYDVWVRIAYHEREVYAALDQIPKISLVMLAGHGDRDSLLLAKRDPVARVVLGEKGSIDISDRELQRHMKNLEENAVFFLCSCSTGEGGSRGKNLANWLSEVSGAKTVISPTKPFSLEYVEVLQAFPFSALMFRRDSRSGGMEDITYMPQHY